MQFEVSDALIASVIALLITGIFVHVAAKIVVGESKYLRALLAAFLGNLLAGLVLLGTGGGLLGAFLAVAAWALVVAVLYRAKWIAGALVGVVAWLLWLGVQLLMRLLLG